MASRFRALVEKVGLADPHYDDYEDEGYELEPSAHDLIEERGHDAEVTHINSRNNLAVAAPAERAPQRISAVHPRSYNDAKNIGDSFRRGIPVIMNLTDMDDSDAKRMVDFSAGLVYGLYGSIERVTAKVFLLTPKNTEMYHGDEHAAPDSKGFFNQS